MISLLRKLRQFINDPVLRQWLGGRMLGRWQATPPFNEGRPPYLSGHGISPDTDLTAKTTTGRGRDDSRVETPPPSHPITLRLPGTTLTIEPGQESLLMQRRFADIETQLGLHRFAWLPEAGETLDPTWLHATWLAWDRHHGTPRTGWPWHPYTVAERAINLIRADERIGWLGSRDAFRDILAIHADHVARNLEYFGDHNTSNHLANNGRALYIIGLTLGIDLYASQGARILREEARRIFRPSGVLREGSSHYHHLLTKNYIDAWLYARRYRRPEADHLATISRRALAVAHSLVLPGGLPLIGDVSPDCTPASLRDLVDVKGGDGSGWLNTLDADDRQAVHDLRERLPTVDGDALAGDGWLRAEHGPWSGLWYLSPHGFPPMPGHGHQDAGGFEMHFGAEPLFVDLGRRSYEAAGDIDTRAGAHNSLTIDGREPYPPNKPYYTPDFRRRVSGPFPSILATADGVELGHHGYARFAGLGKVTRRWRFDGNRLIVEDRVDGRGRHRIVRRLHTPMPVTRDGNDLVAQGRSGRFLVTSDAEMAFNPSAWWRAYGECAPANTIEISCTTDLPWTGFISVSTAGRAE